MIWNWMFSHIDGNCKEEHDLIWKATLICSLNGSSIGFGKNKALTLTDMLTSKFHSGQDSRLMCCVFAYSKFAVNFANTQLLAG